MVHYLAQLLVLERVWGRASRSTGVSCGQKVDFNPFLEFFAAIISGLEKLVELEWASKPFWLLTDALMAEIFLFTVSCIVFAFSFFKARKKRAAN